MVHPTPAHFQSRSIPLISRTHPACGIRLRAQVLTSIGLLGYACKRCAERDPTRDDDGLFALLDGIERYSLRGKRIV